MLNEINKREPLMRELYIDLYGELLDILENGEQV